MGAEGCFNCFPYSHDRTLHWSTAQITRLSCLARRERSLGDAHRSRLSVPAPSERLQIQTDQDKAALRSLVELKDVPKSGTADLYFGLSAPAGKEGQWIKTNPGKGWFVYLRLYGPEGPAFNGPWKPGDYTETGSNGLRAWHAVRVLHHAVHRLQRIPVGVCKGPELAGFLYRLPTAGVT